MSDVLKSAMISGDNIAVVVKLEDLIEFHRYLLESKLETQISENSQERYLTIKQVCSLISVDASTLWRWRRQGYINPVIIGRKRLYKESDVRRLISEKSE